MKKVIDEIDGYESEIDIMTKLNNSIQKQTKELELLKEKMREVAQQKIGVDETSIKFVGSHDNSITVIFSNIPQIKLNEGIKLEDIIENHKEYTKEVVTYKLVDNLAELVDTDPIAGELFRITYNTPQVRIK